MSQTSDGRRPRRHNALIDSAEELAAGVGRLGYGLLSLGLDLLPGQSRRHMHNAVRELSYAFAELPRTFADIAGQAVEEWAAASDAPGDAPADAPAAAGERPAATVRRVRVTPEPAAPAAESVRVAVASGVQSIRIDAEPAPAPLGGAAAPAAPAASAVTIAHIEYDPPGRDVDGEYVLIRNGAATPADLTGWTLRDARASHVFVFPGFSLAPGAEVRVWTKAGAADEANLYWGERGAIWNNDGDTGSLKDAAGALVSSFTYAGSR